MRFYDMKANHQPIVSISSARMSSETGCLAAMLHANVLECIVCDAFFPIQQI